MCPEVESVPRRHHYIPESLLKGFCCAEKPGNIWVIPRDQSDDMKPFRSAVINVACEGDYHSIEQEGGTVDHASIEQALSKIETHQIEWIKTVIRKGAVYPSDFSDAAALISTYRARVPSFKEHVRKSQEAVIRHTMDQVIDRGIVPFPEGMTEDAKAQILRERSSIFEIDIDNGKLVNLMMTAAFSPRVIAEFSRMGFSLGVIPEGAGFFVLGDSPVSVAAIGAAPDIATAIGPGSPYLELCMPMTKKTCLIAQWRELPAQVTLLPETVRKINRRSCQMASRFIFSPIGDAETREMVETMKIKRAGLQVKTLPTTNGAYFLQYMVPVYCDSKIIP